MSTGPDHPPLPPLLFVTGAPGAGKSAVARVLLGFDLDVLVFDGDWLLQPASDLAGGPVAEAEALWPAYDRLWVAILEMVTRNGRAALLFTPMEPRSLPSVSAPDCVAWCLLDCDEEDRIARLREWGRNRYEIEDALADADMLRSQVDVVVDTGGTTPAEAAADVAEWIHALVNDGLDGRRNR